MILISLFFSQMVFAATETQNFSAKGLREVEVENGSGKVVVNATGAAEATVVVDKRKISSSCVVTVRRDGNKLVAKAEQTGHWSSKNVCEVDFTLRVPKAVDLDLEVGNGNVSVEGTEGELDFKLGNGDLVAKGAFRKVDGNSGNGKTTIHGLLGEAEVKSGNGALELQYAAPPAAGELELKIGNGDATVRFPKGSQVRTEFVGALGKLTNQLGDTPSAAFQVKAKAGTGNLTVQAY
ncbi:hypothetical protein K2X33_08700 [bacterium]|nr:hypothetical protein [bacterium]